MKRLSLTNGRQLGLRAIVALLFVLVLAGCSTSTNDAAFSLTGVDWQWQNLTNTSGTTTVPDPAAYTLRFNTDNTLNGTADCNNFAGSYTQDNGGIQINLGPMTLAACGPDSLDSVYLAALGTIVAGGPDGTGDLALENAGGETRMIFSNPNTAAGTTASGGILGFPWWYWLLGLLLLGLLVWLFGRGRSPEPAPAPKPAAAPATKPVVAATAAPAAAPAKPAPVVADDLTRIEGIGPKISGILMGAGIMTFAELSMKSTDQLRDILAASDLSGSYGDPTTWPAQAELAAAGEWDALDSMQASLKGGRLE